MLQEVVLSPLAHSHPQMRHPPCLFSVALLSYRVGKTSLEMREIFRFFLHYILLDHPLIFLLDNLV